MFQPVAALALASLAVVLGALGDPATANAQPSGNRQMVSWVVLSNTHVEFKLDQVRKKLDELYPGLFLPPRDKGNFLVAGPVPGQFLIQSSAPAAAGTFLLQSVPGPYTKFSDFAAWITNLALRQKAEAQCCWLSVDLVIKHTTEEDAYRFIGRLLAKLAPADAAVLVHPTKPIAIPFDDSVRRRLAADGQIPSRP